MTADDRPSTARRQIAIALAHDPEGGRAPVVTARGYGALAEKILDLAFANNVKVRTDPDLAQVLAAVEVDSDIPVEAFAAVAEILAYMYQANARLGGFAPPGGEPPARDATPREATPREATAP